MELKIQQSWLQKHREADEGHDFSAGDLMLRHPETMVAEDAHAPAMTNAAFGTLIQLWRVDHRMTMQKLAEAADVDLDEIQSIETDETYRPEAQTVCALASLMKVPELSLLQLTGNVVELDPNFVEYSMAFAANAKQWNQISKEQRRLLQGFMKYLSGR
jgi:transcriptional regulator with XRE-family HTH domain